MSDRRHQWRVVRMFVLCGVLPIIAARLIDISLPQSRWVQAPLHSTMEALGSFAALCLSALLLMSPEKGSNGRVWSVCALLGMGILDAFHSAVSPGGTFVWLHSTATLLGGLFFAMVWMPERVAVSRAARVLPSAVGVGASTFGVVSVSLPGILPAMVIGGSFTSTACALNLLGGLFFLVAAARFLTRPREGGSSGDALFASLCLLFASAALSFRFSHLWDTAWWFWHLLRLTAFLIILGHMLVLYHRAGEEQRRLNRALRTLSECNQAVVRTRDEAQLRNEVCRILVGEGGYRFAWVGYAEHDEAKTVRPVARAGHEDGYLALANIEWGDTERGRGPTGTAIRTGQPYVAHNVKTDPLFAPWVTEATRRGYASSIALPLVLDGQPLGALMLYSQTVDSFDDPEVRLLAELSHDLAYGIQALRTRAERERAEEALRQSEERLDFALEMSHVGAWELDLLKGTAHRTLIHDRIFGYETLLPQWTYEMFLEHVLPEDRPDVDRMFREATAAQTVWSFECRIRRPDGEVRWIWAAGGHERNSEGKPARMSGIVQDITARKRAEEEIRKLNDELEQRVAQRTSELEATNKELEAFTYSVSHDLRAPLRHIDGFSKLLLEEHGAEVSDQARHYLTRVRDGARRMGQLVDDLLNLSRVGRQELRRHIVGLSALLEEAQRDLQPEMEGRKIDWRISPLPFVECDPALMKQVFANLLSNALKYTRPRERAVIEVGTMTRDDQAVVSVRDNGVGFSMKYADKLFGIFQRLHRQEDFEGTGVGLATVQRIIHKHGGRIWAESAVNEGATFHFTLPVTE